jgi:hypothetical protein
MRTLSNQILPLSTPLRPIFSPSSSIFHAGDQPAVLVAEGHDKGMDAVFLVADDQLGEHRSDPAVARGIADVLLVRPRRRGVDHELLRIGVIGRGRLKLPYVGAVRALGHREAAGQLERGGRLQVSLVMATGPQLMDRAAPQAELDAELDQQ